MKKKVLLSVLMSLGILVVGIGAAYAINTFKANQEGFRQAGEGQAARITMRVEAGMADANSLLIPDDATYPQYSPGGALSRKWTAPLELCGQGRCAARAADRLPLRVPTQRAAQRDSPDASSSPAT